MPELEPITDGLITLRPPHAGDAARLIAGRDAEFHRWLGDGAATPNPTACIVVEDAIVGWVDYDVERSWLASGEVNVGYNVFAPHRGRGFASRAVRLLMHHLALIGQYHTATLLIHPENRRSLALAARTRFRRCQNLDGNPYFKAPVPPTIYCDDTVRIRPVQIDDTDGHLASIDDAQISWMWLPAQRESWHAMDPAAQREHVRRWLSTTSAGFGRGPKWVFAIMNADTGEYAGYVDCDLANVHVPHGEANVSYAAHPAHRGNGYVSRAVRLLLAFIADHTGAREAHLIIDTRNVPSRRVAHAVGATEQDRWIDAAGHTMVRHTCALHDGAAAWH